MIVVTGGLGFIGSHLVDGLLERGEDVRVVDDVSEGREENLSKPGAVELVEADITEEVDWLDGAEAVFHLAADPDVKSSVEEPAQSFRVNVDGSFNVLEAARRAGVGSFVFASSAGTIYGDCPEPATEDHPLRPISPYGASKAAFEMYLSAYSHAYGMDCPVLRYGNIIGPRSRHGVVWDFFHKLRENPQQLVILGDGQQEKSYLHVSDAVSATLLAWEKAKGFSPYNVASDRTLKVTELAGVVCDELRVNPQFRFTGGERGWKGDVRVARTDIHKLQSWGWRPEYEPEEAVRSQVRWMVDEFGFGD